MQPGSHRENPVPFGRTPRASARTAVRLLAVLLLLPLAFGRPAPAPAEDDPVPVVTLGATPSGGQNPGINGTFAFEVSATDNGTVERVTMDIVSESSGYQTSVLHREVTASPYRFYSCQNVTEGQNYKAVFRAYDDVDGVGTLTTDAFAAPAAGPFIGITSPAHNSTWPVGYAIPLSLAWTQRPVDATVTRVEWFRNRTTRVAYDILTPIEQPMTWTQATAGTYKLLARAQDINGVKQEREYTVNVTLDPMVALLPTPAGEQAHGINSTFCIAVEATPSTNATISRVTMDILSESYGYQTSVLSREDTTAPYQFYCREEITEGQSYKARFIAYDSESRTHTLTTDAFPANQVGPYVNMTVPAAGTSYPAGTSVGLQANWSQHPAEVHIDTLEWFVDGTSVASDAYPIQQPMPWIPPTAGT